MKRVAYFSAVLAVLVFSGCSSKGPSIDATANGSVSGNGSNNAGMATSENKNTDSTAVIAPITNANSADKGSSSTDTSNNQIASILFDYDKYEIRANMQQSIKVNAELLKAKTVKLEGNCDEFGSDEYNFALGLKRTNAVKSALVNEGMNADSITMVSLGEGNPMCMEKTQECWAQNRRVDFKLP
ncbi:MAG: OmpA family protein [Sulfuricurvum sp.]|nr:OmpA family protein [Sulfuricurvum sp.]